MKSNLIIRHLSFTGLDRPPALIRFEPGLNIIYGGSDTGKSFILESLDYMLGGDKPLRDIPERQGYDRVLLGIQTGPGVFFTLVRGVNKGQFRLYEGLHEIVPNNLSSRALRAKHSGEQDNTLSVFLLSRIGLSNKYVRTNKNGKIRSLSFRDLCRLCIVHEDDIHKQRSPLESGQWPTKTVEYSTFKLLITGVDDSSMIAEDLGTARPQVVHAKIEAFDEVVGAYRQKLGETTADFSGDLSAQLERIENSLSVEERDLQEAEGQFKELVKKRNELRERLDRGLERQAEIHELVARFGLLREHYQSDLRRLEGIRESGSLIEVLPPERCPLCGADPDHQHRDVDSGVNMETLIRAVDSEHAKIGILQKELEDTVNQLTKESNIFDQKVPAIEDSLKSVEERIQFLNSVIGEKRATYTALVDTRANLRSAISLKSLMDEIITKRQDLQNIDVEVVNEEPSPEISSTQLAAFAHEVEILLQRWGVPHSTPVHFDEGMRDIIVGTLPRSSRGKGIRAITHSAFNAGLLKLCWDNDRPHPGFVVLDSPLLSYREPDGPDDDLRGTDVHTRFYQYFAEWTDRQVIVIENLDPPREVLERSQINPISFGTNRLDRNGFFPRPQP